MAAAAHLNRLRNSVVGPVTLGELTARLGLEGAGLLILLVSVPFLHPFPMAGLTIPVGLLIAATGVQLALGRQAPYLPRFVSARSLEPETVRKILGAAERLLVVLERFARPRWQAVARSPRLIGAAVTVTGFFFALPLYFPFGNLLSAAGLVLMGLGLLEEDGLLTLLGLMLAAASFAYHVAGLALACAGLLQLAHRYL